MGLNLSVTPVQVVFYIFVVLLGIVGNVFVLCVISDSVLKDPSGGRNSDIILLNVALSNLLLSAARNILLVISDLGIELYLARTWCRLLMGVWVWLRSVNVWSTVFLSAFHFQTLRRVTPTGNITGPRGLPKPLLMSLGLVWLINLLYSVPAHIYSTSGTKNSTETLMLVSSTTRPLLGCVWNFPSSYSGLAYATASMVINEIIPIILMAFTSIGSLCTLYSHGRKHLVKGAPVIKREPAEKRAAKVIVVLVVLFILTWGTSLFSINYFNYNRGKSTQFILAIARFANTLFIAMSPIVLAVGHRRLRSVVQSVLVFRFMRPLNACFWIK
ncbi:olfactory receptor class A-like protein 4 [Aplochiton taeniatus]